MYKIFDTKGLIYLNHSTTFQLSISELVLFFILFFFVVVVVFVVVFWLYC